MIVLFTAEDWLGEKTIEQLIEYEGEALQWLIDKCENKYHVFNNAKRCDKKQDAELLEKIEEIVAENKNHCEMDRKILQKVQEKKNAEKYKEGDGAETERNHQIKDG